MDKYYSMFNHPLQLFPRVKFQQMVKETHAERHAKGITCWGQFVRHALLSIGACPGVPTSSGDYRMSPKLRRQTRASWDHRSQVIPPCLLPMNNIPGNSIRKSLSSSLSDIGCRQAIGKKKFRFKNKLIGMDSTIMPLDIRGWVTPIKCDGVKIG